MNRPRFRNDVNIFHLTVSPFLIIFLFIFSNSILVLVCKFVRENHSFLNSRSYSFFFYITFYSCLNKGWVLMSWVSNRIRDLDNRCIQRNNRLENFWKTNTISYAITMVRQSLTSRIFFHQLTDHHTIGKTMNRKTTTPKEKT